MLKHIKSLLLDNSRVIALVITSIIITLSLINTKSLASTNIKVSDKVMHAGAYLILIWSWLHVFSKKKQRIPILVILIFFGILLEVLQGILTNYRTADWQDVIANIIGLVVGLISFKKVHGFVFNET